MSPIVVSPLSQLDQVAHHYRPIFMISLVNQEMAVERPPSVDAERHLILQFNDINTAQPNLVLAQPSDVVNIIRFAHRWKRQQPLLIHCWMGISRSPAAAFIVACALSNIGTELKLAYELRRTAPLVTPNLRLIALADSVLNRKGKMIEAINAIGRGSPACQGHAFELNF